MPYLKLNTSYSERSLELIYSDICEIYNNNHYFVLFADDYSKFNILK